MEILFVWWVWMIFAVLMLIFEMIVPGFVVACFSVGAVGAAIAAAIGLSSNIQLVVFSVLSLLVLAFVRPFAIKYLLKGKNSQFNTNNAALPDRIGKVVESIDNHKFKGYVKIDGDEFMARSENGEFIEQGTDVKIIRIDSTILIVKKYIKQ